MKLQINRLAYKDKTSSASIFWVSKFIKGKIRIEEEKIRHYIQQQSSNNSGPNLNDVQLRELSPSQWPTRLYTTELGDIEIQLHFGTQDLNSEDNIVAFESHSIVLLSDLDNLDNFHDIEHFFLFDRGNHL